MHFKSFLFLSLICPCLSYADFKTCYRQIEQNFFNPILVSQALSLHFTFPQSSWNEVNRKLQQNASQVPRLVRERAVRMSPNPFNVPFNYHEAAELLRQALLEVLANTMAEFQVTNPSQIKAIFDYLRIRQLHQITECFGEGEFGP